MVFDGKITSKLSELPTEALLCACVRKTTVQMFSFAPPPPPPPVTSYISGTYILCLNQDFQDFIFTPQKNGDSL
ncbi:hypothetical protein R83H12_01954 [Fibrobacteria bacterium R8-3-H12]